MEYSYIIMAVVSVAAVLVYIYYSPQQYDQQTIRIDNVTLDTEVAKSWVQRTRGLIGHTPLKETQGMLFVPETEDFHGIWMQNMSFPIDILWVSKDLEIIHIVENAQPCLVNCPIYKPKEKALYVLEVQSGFVQKHGIAVGDKIKLGDS
jgi:uncharacterized protein